MILGQRIFEHGGNSSKMRVPVRQGRAWRVTFLGGVIARFDNAIIGF